MELAFDIFNDVFANYENTLKCNQSYDDAKSRMIFICNMLKQANENKSYNISSTVQIECPGRKQAIGDYMVKVSGYVMTHEKMCFKIFSYVSDGIISQNAMRNILDDVYYNGCVDNCFDNNIEKELKKQIFWLTLQEDINYPIEKGKLGRKHPLYRYAEALIAADRNNEKSLSDVIVRVNHTRPKTLDFWKSSIAPRYYK